MFNRKQSFLRRIVSLLPIQGNRCIHQSPLFAALALWFVLSFASFAQESASYTDAVGARSAWIADSAEVRRLISKAKAVADAISGLKREREATEKNLKSLQAERTRALDEMLKGEFCSECGRPASKIEREERVPFESHVRRVRGVKKGATPEQIKKLEEDYDRLINPLKAKVVALEAKKRELDSECLLGGSDLKARIRIYHQNIDAEAKLRSQEWHVERARLQERLDHLLEELGQAELALTQNEDSQKRELLQLNVQVLQKQFTDAHRRAMADHARADQQATDFTKAATADIERHRKSAETLGDACWNATAFMTESFLKKSIFCYIAPIKRYDRGPVGGGDIRTLLEGGDSNRRAPSDGAPKKSLKELLEGK
jgi:hypothetical protein